MTDLSPAPSPLPLTSDEQHLQTLLTEAKHHPAVHHAFLRRFATGAYPDATAVLRRYALEYSAYASWFPRYLEAVIDRLDDPAHQALLRRNLDEEQGNYDADECDELRRAGIRVELVQGVPHPQLFRRFCRAIGITDDELARPCRAADQWRREFHAMLENASPAAAVGALGMGTEYVVRPIYEQLLRGIQALGTLHRDDYVFFELHCLVDDQHQADLLHIARELAPNTDGVRELRRGMLGALRLRQRFWDQLYDGLLEQQMRIGS